MTDEDFLTAFENATLREADFNHKAHVQAGFLMLKKYGFAHSVIRYRTALKALTERFGVPEKYHETITIAFLAVINEHKARRPENDFDAFCAHNPDILSPRALGAYYTREELAAPLARRVFVLPQKKQS